MLTIKVEGLGRFEEMAEQLLNDEARQQSYLLQ